MEQKLKDQLKMAADMLRTQKAEYEAQFEEFIKNMYTPEVKTMLDTIIDASNKSYLFANLTSDGKSLCHQRNYRHPEIRSCGGALHHSFGLYGNFELRYRDRDFEELESHIKNLRKNQKWFKVLQDKAPEIIQDITQKYKNITETQTDKMDKIFKMLDVEQEPARHIKVTVEWI